LLLLRGRRGGRRRGGGGGRLDFTSLARAGGVGLGRTVKEVPGQAVLGQTCVAMEDVTISMCSVGECIHLQCQRAGQPEQGVFSLWAKGRYDREGVMIQAAIGCWRI
jgi:hypothetical protein